MSRKQTILVAIFINAGLLVLLCVAALSSEEETALPDIAIQQEVSIPEPVASPPVYVSAPVHEPVAQESAPAFSVPEVVHTLPPVAAVEPVAATPVAEPAYKEVTVKAGDTLEKIAKASHVSVDDIIKYNKLPSTFLRIGQVLRIPLSQSSVKQAVKAQVKKEGYYIVKAGDSPWSIAMKHHMKPEELLRMNNMSEEKARKMKPGDRIRIQ